MGNVSAEGNQSLIIDDDLNYDDSFENNQDEENFEENSTEIITPPRIISDVPCPNNTHPINNSMPSPDFNNSDNSMPNLDFNNTNSNEIKSFSSSNESSNGINHDSDLNNNRNIQINKKDFLVFEHEKINNRLTKYCDNICTVNHDFNIDESIFGEEKNEDVIQLAFSNVIASEESESIIFVGESQYDRINNLLHKYDKSYVPGELQSSDRSRLLKRKQRKFEKHEICDDLLYECNFLKLSPHQKEFVHYLVDRFCDDFKFLHARAKKEAIILAFIFYVKKIDDSRIKVSNYSICKKYGLKDDVFLLIVCRMCDSFVKSSPIRYKESTRYDHEILSRNGGLIY